MITTYAVYPFLTSQYAMAIYLFGTRSFSSVTPPSIPTEYHIPVKQYAATNYSISQLDNALAMGYITQQEYDDTSAYKI